MSVTDGLIDKVETKVVAATAGTVGGGVVATFVTYIVGVYCYGADATADSGTSAIGAVPAPVIGIIGFVLTAAGAWFAGRSAPHTSRTVVEIPPPSAPSDPAHADSGDGDLSGGDASATEVSFND